MACKRRDEDKVLYKYNEIVLPQLYQTELLFRSHDQMGHQGIDKVYQRILKRFEWPGMKKACEKWVTACLSCQQVKDPRKLRFPLQSIESCEFNELVQIDHQKICMTDSGYNQVLVMIYHFTKYAEAVPCITASAEETCDHLINTWIARHGCPMTFQSDYRTAFVGELTEELMRRSSSLNDISSPDKWLGGKAESNISIDAEGILFQVHDRLGKISFTGDGSLQKHTTLHHRS